MSTTIQKTFLSAKNTPDENLALLAKGQYFSEEVYTAKHNLKNFYNASGIAAVALSTAIIGLAILCGKFWSPYGYMAGVLLVIVPISVKAFRKKIAFYERHYLHERTQLNGIYNACSLHISTQLVAASLRINAELNKEGEYPNEGEVAELNHLLQKINSCVATLKNENTTFSLFPTTTEFTDGTRAQIRSNLNSMGLFRFLGSLNSSPNFSKLQTSTLESLLVLHQRITQLVEFEKSDGLGQTRVQRIQNPSGRRKWHAWVGESNQPTASISQCLEGMYRGCDWNEDYAHVLRQLEKLKHFDINVNVKMDAN